eukprot:COSAG02_NODE_539_length_20605_cov_93.802155_15_plen_509_part_00
MCSSRACLRSARARAHTGTHARAYSFAAPRRRATLLTTRTQREGGQTKTRGEMVGCVSLDELELELSAAEAEHAALVVEQASSRSRDVVEAELADLAERHRVVRAELAALEDRGSRLDKIASRVAVLSRHRESIFADQARTAQEAAAARQVADQENAARLEEELEPRLETEPVTETEVQQEPQPEAARALDEEEALLCCGPEELEHLLQRGITVERRVGRGRCVVATRALPAGSEVMSVAAVTAVVRPAHQGSRCNCCLKKADTKLLRCSGCRSAFYCSATCQKLEWPSHKRECGCLSAAAERELEGDSLGDALLLGRLLHNEQRQQSKQTPNFYARAGLDPLSDPDRPVLQQGVNAVVAMQWHEHDVDCALQLAQQAADVGFLPLEPPSASVSPVASPQQSTGKKKCKSKKKARGKKNAVTVSNVKSVPVGGLRAAAVRLAQFRCNNFGITDELLLPIGAGIFPAAGTLAVYICNFVEQNDQCDTLLNLAWMSRSATESFLRTERGA